MNPLGASRNKARGPSRIPCVDGVWLLLASLPFRGAVAVGAAGCWGSLRLRNAGVAAVQENTAVVEEEPALSPWLAMALTMRRPTRYYRVHETMGMAFQLVDKRS